jgi:fructose-1,6-bisphosphatase II / sedoheptulose-1,7-bisphosphatase
MEKIAIGPGYPKGVVDLDAPAGENIAKLAKAKGVKPDAITALILDRPRHADMIAAVRKTGAAVRLITDGDVAGVIHTADHAATGIDIYMGIGGAPEGVLAAAALRCIGGQMQCRLILDSEEKRERAAKMGVKDPRKKYQIVDMVKGDCLFAATGVTNGDLLRGVKFGKDVIETETVVMRSVTGTVRWVRAELERSMTNFVTDAMTSAPAIYARNFTAAELRDMAAFYRTPTGVKALQQLPSVTAEVTGLIMPRLPVFQQELAAGIQGILSKHGYKN